MPTLSRVVVLLAAILISLPSTAGFSAAPKFNASVIAGDPDKDRGDYDTGIGLKLGFTRSISENIDLEIFTSSISFDSDSINKLRQTAVGVDANIFLRNNSKLQPYVVIGTGLQRSTFSGSSNKVQNNFADLGLGFLQQLSQSGLALKADFRVRRDFFDSPVKGTEERDDLIAHIGISLPLGDAQAATKSSAPVQSGTSNANSSYQDSDNDGVTDSTDYCPGTAQDAAVDVNGCSRSQNGIAPADINEQTAQAAEIVPATNQTTNPVNTDPTADDDGDGVENQKDSCPGTARTEPVGLDGCSDGQLEKQAQAQQKNTPATQSKPPAVAQPAPATETTTQAAVSDSQISSTSTSIEFIGSTTELSRNGQQSVAEVAKELLHRRSLNATINASSGRQQDNQNIAYRRAKIIKNLISRYGVQANRVSIGPNSQSGVSEVQLHTK